MSFAFNPTTTPVSGSSTTIWGDILGGVTDIFGGWASYDLKKREIKKKGINGGQPPNPAPQPTMRDPFSMGSMTTYQKWSLGLAAAGFALILIGFLRGRKK